MTIKKNFKVLISEQREYLVEADSKEEAEEKMQEGDWIKELDMACNDIEILDIEETNVSEEEEEEDL